MSATRTMTAALLIVLGAAGATRAESGGSFRTWDHLARSQALAGAATLGGGGAESLFNQPASLVDLKGWQMGAAMMPSAGSGLPLTNSTLVIARGGGFPDRSSPERRLASRWALACGVQHLGARLSDDSGWGETGLVFGVGWSPLPWLATGLRTSWVQGGSEDGQDRGSALALAGGIRLLLLESGLELGLLADDIYHRFAWRNGEQRSREPSRLISLGAVLPGRIRMEIGVRHTSVRLSRFIGGLEWGPWRNRLTLRAGLRQDRDLSTRILPACGFGVHLASWHLDYAFRIDGGSGAGSRHTFSLLRGGGL